MLNFGLYQIISSTSAKLCTSPQAAWFQKSRCFLAQASPDDAAFMNNWKHIPSFNGWCIGVLRSKMWTGNCTRSFSTEWGLPKSAGLCLWMSTRVKDVDVFKSSARSLVLSDSLRGYLVSSCLLLFCLPDVLIFCNLQSGSEHAQQLRAPHAAKFARQHHTRDHRRSYGQNGPWWQIITPECRANDQSCTCKWLMTHVCCKKTHTEFDYRRGKPPAQPFGKRRARDINDWRVETQR